MGPRVQRCKLHILLNLPGGESAGLIKGGTDLSQPTHEQWSPTNNYKYVEVGLPNY
jgi:hypothetical protein